MLCTGAESTVLADAAPPPPPARVPTSARPINYAVLKFLQEGVMGKVFSGKRKRDKKGVAMKFFGYTRQLPRLESVVTEIELMRSLAGIDGVIQLEDVFMDTARGMIVGRRSALPYPVIAMELCSGGDMFDRINTRTFVSERALSRLFKSVITAVGSLHSRRYVHRDIKPENLMLAEDSEQSPVKLIDFGMMVQLDPECGVYAEPHVRGTPGYFAPESLAEPSLYSQKTDMWQLGCVLYAMLSGLMAFSPNSKELIACGQYEVMDGYGWDGISAAGKDLVARLLVVDPDVRIGIDGILSHPWITSEATPDVSLGNEYSNRVKYLSLRQKLKKFFVESNIVQANQIRRQRLQEEVPLMSACGFGSFFSQSSDAFSRKLFQLKSVVLEVMSSRRGADSAPPSKKLRACTDQLKYDTFVKAMIMAELPELGCPGVFSIFDMDGSGSIDLKEFLLTMIAFRPAASSASTSESIRESALLYFNVFDLNDNGYIDLEEMKLVVSCFLLDELENPTYSTIGSRPTSNDMSKALEGGESVTVETVEGLFKEFDKSKDGQIDFEEFVLLYEALLKSTSDRKSMMSMC